MVQARIVLPETEASGAGLFVDVTGTGIVVVFGVVDEEVVDAVEE